MVPSDISALPELQEMHPAAGYVGARCSCLHVLAEDGVHSPCDWISVLATGRLQTIKALAFLHGRCLVKPQQPEDHGCFSRRGSKGSCRAGGTLH